MQDMKKYLNSDISCFVNAMLVVLILLASSCSSNWKYEYLKTKEPHRISAVVGNTTTETSKKTDISDELKESEAKIEEDTTYQADNLDDQMQITSDGKVIYKDTSGIKLNPVFVFDSKSKTTPVDTSGRLNMSLTVSVPKDLLASNWQMRLHPKIYIRQNKVETWDFYSDYLFITGSVYRDKQIRGYERYANYLSKIYSGNSGYENSFDLNKLLDTSISNFVNKYQLEYFIERNFPEIYAFKDDTSYISDEKFASVLGVDKDNIIKHFYNKSLDTKIKELTKNKKKNYNEWVYNTIIEDSIHTDNIILRDTLEKFDKLYSQVREIILEDDSLRESYYNYFDKIKEDNTTEYPKLMSDNFKNDDNTSTASQTEKKQKKVSKNDKENNKDSDIKKSKEKIKKEKIKKDKKQKDSKKEREDKKIKETKDKRIEEKQKDSNTTNNINGKIKLSNFNKTKFKLDTAMVIYGDDSSRIFMKFNYSTTLNAFNYPNIDRVYIGISGDVYDDTTHIYNFSMNKEERLEYPIISTANLADTTEIIYDKYPQLRKANHGANYSIEFAKNNAVLNPNFGNNEQVIADIKSSLDALMKNAEFDLDSIIVSATASPEGAITVNQRFSGQRSDAVSKYFKNYVDANKWKYRSGVDSLRKETLESIESIQASDLLTDKEKEEFIKDERKKLESIKIPEIEFKVHPIAENWDDLWSLVTNDSIMTDKDKNQFYSTFEKIDNLDIRENTMKKHPYYDYMSKELYPQIRVVKFDFHMHRKGQEHDTVWLYKPSEKYLEGVKALRNFDFIKAESILKNYPSYNSAICFIVRHKPIQAIKQLEDPSMYIDFEFFKAKRDSLTRLYLSSDSTLIPEKDSIYARMMACKAKMDRAAKIEFLKAKAYVMRGNGEADWNKALQSYLFLIRMDNLNGLYNEALTGNEDIRGAVFGSSKYFTYTAQTDELLQTLPFATVGGVNFSEKIESYTNEITLKIKKEAIKFYNPERLAQYNEERQAYLDMGYTPDIVDKIIFLGIDPPEIEY